MALGTAGFTAAMSVDAIQAGGVAPGDGPIVVPGATGGVGTTGIAMLTKLGYEVVASSGKSDQADFLKSLGRQRGLVARGNVGREQAPPRNRALGGRDRRRWWQHDSPHPPLNQAQWVSWRSQG